MSRIERYASPFRRCASRHSRARHCPPFEVNPQPRFRQQRQHGPGKRTELGAVVAWPTCYPGGRRASTKPAAIPKRGPHGQGLGIASPLGPAADASPRVCSGRTKRGSEGTHPGPRGLGQNHPQRLGDGRHRPARPGPGRADEHAGLPRRTGRRQSRASSCVKCVRCHTAACLRTFSQASTSQGLMSVDNRTTQFGRGEIVG